jgi:hypothetical protein
LSTLLAEFLCCLFSFGAAIQEHGQLIPEIKKPPNPFPSSRRKGYIKEDFQKCHITFCT